MPMKKKQSKDNSQASVTLPVVNAHAAGIDVGSRFHMVCVGQNRDKSVREFGVTTPALHDLCVYLQAHGIRQVAMESTGYYWIPLYWMLQSYGFETIVV
jgi:transposase